MKEMKEILTVHAAVFPLLIAVLALICLAILVIAYFVAKRYFSNCKITDRRKKVLTVLSVLTVFLILFTAVFGIILDSILKRTDLVGINPAALDFESAKELIKLASSKYMPEDILPGGAKTGKVFDLVALAQIRLQSQYLMYFLFGMLLILFLLFLVIYFAKKQRETFFTTKVTTRLAIFSALSIVLYFAKFNVPFMFPEFLEIHVSDVPALLAGFMMGPPAGAVVIIIRALIKLPFTSTGGIGELGDLILGLVFVLSSSLIYSKLKTKKGAMISLIVGAVCCTAAAVVVNRFILIPFFATLYSWNAVVGMVSKLYKDISQESFYNYFLPLAAIPFNLLRCIFCVLVTFFLYKPTKMVFGLVEKKVIKKKN